MRISVMLVPLGSLAVSVLAGCEPSESSHYVADQEREQSVPSGNGWEFVDMQNDELRRENERLKAERDKALADKTILEGQRDVAIAERDDARGGHLRYKLWLGLIIGVIACGIVGVVGWVGSALLRKPKVLSTAEEKDCCPRCGMKRTPGETVCRECGTHF